MPPKRAKKLRSNSNVQTPKNAKRSRTGKLADTSNAPVPLPPQSGLNTADEGQTITSTSNSKEPARELPEIDPADDPFASWQPPTHPHHIQFVVVV